MLADYLQSIDQYSLRPRSAGITDPEVAWASLTEKARLRHKASRSKRACSLGPRITNGRDEGFIQQLFDDSPEAHGNGHIWVAALSACSQVT